MNWYAYCANNPEMYIDHDGKRFRLGDDATKNELAEFNNAIEYLKKKSITAKQLIEKLENTPIIITIKFVYGKRDYYDDIFNTIYWNPKMGVRTNRGIMSPALCLAHEMGHAINDINNLLKYVGHYEDGVYVFENVTGFEEELRVLTLYEQPIGKELNEGYRLDYYEVGELHVFLTTGATSQTPQSGLTPILWWWFM